VRYPCPDVTWKEVDLPEDLTRKRMAHSSFIFASEALDIRDDFLGSILSRLRSYADRSAPADTWLRSAVESWLESFKVMPPGIKNVELQDWLTSDQRRGEFLSALEWVREDLLQGSAAGAVDLSEVPFEETFLKLRHLVERGGR
jgi:hypothetical protein